VLDGLDDGAPVGIGHVDEHPVDVEHDCLDLHAPTEAARREVSYASARRTASPSRRCAGRRHRRLVAAQGREQARRVRPLGHVEERAVELRRAVQRVHRVGVRVHRRVWVGHVVDDEPDSVGDLTLVDVRRRHRVPARRERRRHVRAPTDSDLDQAVELREHVGDVGWFPHAGMFMSRGV